jgi:hypothetical protein
VHSACRLTHSSAHRRAFPLSCASGAEYLLWRKGVDLNLKLRQRGILLLVGVAGLGVLGCVVVGNLAALRELWFIRQLGSGDDAARDGAIQWLKENGSARVIPALLEHAAARAEEREKALVALESLLPRGSSFQQIDATEKLLTIAREEDRGPSIRGEGALLIEKVGATGLLIRASPSLPAVFPALLKGVRSEDPVLLGICARALCDAWPLSRPELDEALRDASPKSALAFFQGVRRFTKQTRWVHRFSSWARPFADGPRSVAAHLAREHSQPEVRAVGLAFALSTGPSQVDASGNAYDTDLLAECMAPSAPPSLRRAAVRLASYLGNLPDVPDLGSLLLAEPDGSPLLVDLIQACDHNRSDGHYGIYGVDLLDGVPCDWIPSGGRKQIADWTNEVERLKTILRTETDGSLRDAASAALAARYLPRRNRASEKPPSAPIFEVHEWGVWKDGGDFLSVAEATLAELPPFVHRTSASTAAVVAERAKNPWAVTKPVLFFHAAEPLSVVVRVWFFEGRPWTYFPDATDELETTRYSTERPALVDRPGISPPWPLSNVPERFFEIAPWLIPRHPLFSSPGDAIELDGMGVEWRGLRVGYDAALEPFPPAAAPSSWWSFLREVPASPVAVRGEREGFLFYDGSTNVPPPVVPSWADSGSKAIRLSIRSKGEYPAGWDDSSAKWWSWGRQEDADANLRAPIPYAFVIRKDAGAAPRGSVLRGLSCEAEPEVIDVDALDLEGDRLSDAFGEALCAEGLTPEEARSLVRTWETEFFQKSGRRLVTFLPRWLYDVAVPLSVYPAPSRVVRVALVLREIQ